MNFAPAKLALLTVCAVLALSGCQKPTDAPAGKDTATNAGPEAKPGMELSGGELVLPVVKGRPGAVYFTLRNGGDKPVTLVSVHVEGAGKAEMHETSGNTMQPRDKVEVGPGKAVTFVRGALHVMVFDISETLTAGGTSELTLSFADGDKISAPLEISAMTGDGSMATMDHSGMDHSMMDHGDSR